MWTAIARHLLDLLLLSMLLCISCGFGARVLTLMRVKFAYPIEAAVCAIGVGLAVLANGVFIVGVLGWINRTSVLILLAIMLFLSVPSFKVAWRHLITNIYFSFPERLLKLRSIQSPIERIITALCILSLLCVLVGSLSPPTLVEWDSLSYHLAIPKLYLKAGRIYFVHFTSHASFPFTTEMLYTVGLALSGHGLAKLIHFAFFIGCALLLLCVGNSIALQLWHSESQNGSDERLPSPTRSAWAASWALFTMPIALAEASTAYIDMALSFYVLLFVHALMRWLSMRSFGWLGLAAVACGVCMGIKYTGVLLLVPLLCIASLSHVVRKTQRRARLSVTQPLISVAIALIVASPWYIKNLLLTGNPLFPFFYELFDGRWWNEKMAEQYRRHQLEFGTRRTPLHLLLAPWNLTMRSDIPKGFTRSGKEPIRYEVNPNPTSGIGLAFLAFVPTVALMRPLSSYATLLLAICAYWFLAWFYSVQYLRYLLPCIVMLCGIVGYSYSHWFERGVLARAVSQVAMLIAVAYSLLISFAWSLPSVPVVFGIMSEDEYLERTLPSYVAAKYINRHLPKDAKIITYGEPLCYYFERDYLWGDPGHNLLIDYDRVASSSDQMAALFEAYRRLGVTHILLNRRYFALTAEGVPNGLLRRAIEMGLLNQLMSQMGEELYEIDWEAFDAMRKRSD